MTFPACDVVQDIWEEHHEREFNFVDVSAGSKVLISTRVKGLLFGAHTVEVGLPSMEDSVRMLLSAAGIDGGEPAGVREVCRLCGRLPLALGIAGRLAASLGLEQTQNWTGMIEVLREELHESHSGGTEEGMIRASLRGLKGSAHEQECVKSLLMMFALVPEDTYCPLEALLLLFNALHEGSQASMMHLRKYLRVLIDRSLVLNTIDRPSVHDLVLDFVIAQHSDQELRQMHFVAVQAMRSSRPPDAFGRLKFDKTAANDRLSSYVCNEVQHHVSKAWHKQNPGRMTAWLCDTPQDEIVLSAGRCVGTTQLSSMAHAAEDRRDWWLAARYWSVVAKVKFEKEGNVDTLESSSKSLDAIMQVSSRDLSQDDIVHKDDLLMQIVGVLCLAYDQEVIESRSTEIEMALASPAASRDPLAVGAIRFFQLLPLGQIGMVLEHSLGFLEMSRFLIGVSKTHPEASTRAMCRTMGHMFDIFYGDWAALLPEWRTSTWDEVFGRGGHQLLDTVRSYNFDLSHKHNTGIANGDWFLAPALSNVLLLHWGDAAAYCEMTDITLANVRRAVDTPDQTNETLQLIFMLEAWALNVALMWPDRRTKATVAQLMSDFGCTWHNQDKIIARRDHWLRPIGDRTMGKHYCSKEYFKYMTKYSYLLVTDGAGTSAEEVMSTLPTVAQVIDAIVCDVCKPHHVAFGPAFNAFLALAAGACVCDQQPCRCTVWNE